MIDTDRADLVRAINANPRDRIRQLIYADWIEEHYPYDSIKINWWRNRGGHSGLGGLGGRGGRGGRGGLVGRGGFEMLNPENQIMLIEGENALIFLPHGYGFSVLVGHVAQELAQGWIVDPCCEIIDTHNGDCWAQLAAGDKQLRRACEYGSPIIGGARIPYGAFSIPWQGDLPNKN